MKHVFMSIWNGRERICYETGKKLYGEPLSTYFHHVLEKSKYPQYKFCGWNIVLVTPEVHDQVHKDMDKTPKIKKLHLELLEKHLNFGN